MSDRPHRRAGFPYIGSVIAVGLAVIGHSLITTSAHPPGVEWFLLAALTLLTGSFTVKIPSLSARLSVSETFVFASTLLFGAEAGTITVVLDALVISFWLKRSTRSPSRVLFNATAPAIAIWCAAHAFFALSGVPPKGIQASALAGLLAPLFTFALLYYLINTWLVAGAIATERKASAVSIWLSNFTGLSINYFVGCSVAALLVAYTPAIDVTAFGIMIPLLLISYLTFRTSMGRLEDATRHVAQLNDLYLSTIETLAMAVDAKDQITHGHIRRVQVYAVELARRLGVSDDRQLKGIEAAALLHDMGKLAIPEHILNKPGKLNHAEFEKMKRHADIGADLLSSIPFPYPVVPIVRHHHENWDGTGYPNGLAGTDIPLGARILSVVDCFDALTSDRPYRPRLSDKDSFDILRERRGTMYDPLIVDTFIQSHALIAPLATAAGQQARTLLTGNLVETAADFIAKGHRTAAATTERHELAPVRQQIVRTLSYREALAAIGQAAQELTPATVLAWYRYDAELDALTCTESCGDADGVLRGLTIHSGQRTSGWTAANRCAAVNSSAALDLAELQRAFDPPLASTLSVPVVSSGTLRGVLAFYSPSQEPYNADSQNLAEQLAQILAEHLDKIDGAGSVVPFPGAQRAIAARK